MPLARCGLSVPRACMQLFDFDCGIGEPVEATLSHAYNAVMLQGLPHRVVKIKPFGICCRHKSTIKW